VPEPDDLERGRAAFASRAWATAFKNLTEADQQSGLEPGDLELLATAAYLSGHNDQCVETLARAFHTYVEAGNIPRAAECAYWLAFSLINRGEHAQVSGWVSRALRLLDDDGTDCVQRGYLLTLTSVQKLMQSGDVDGALAGLEDVVPIAQRFQDRNLLAMSSLIRGQAMVVHGKTSEAMALFDEIMVAATANELSEVITGLAYCAVIGTCQDVFDVRRAREWTRALSRWCEDQPELVPYSGHCLVHRAEIYQLHGEWQDAALAVETAHHRYELADDWFSNGMAYYQEGELLRHRGRLEAAEQAYQEANRRGHDPQPGWTLLRLAQGQADTAARTSRRLVAEAGEPFRRARMLRAHVDIMLAVGELAEARQASAELSAICSTASVPMLEAIAERAAGAVCLADNDAATALAPLRRAAATWREIDAPYELARTRELIGLALRALDDNEGAQLEFEAAATAYDQLGAIPDLQRVRPIVTGADRVSVLTAREIEVLRLVASGKTNRAIAGALVLSEKTVARHISNIFVKLGLSSRAAATAYAYEHDLV
jgi:DNA-binding CsgD family transcriptional regulator/tetratricopeptide (TPR) repeat protein